MFDEALHCDSSLFDIFRRYKYLREFKLSHPGYFEPIGTMIFCGAQGSGKTLSAVNYVCNVLKAFPAAILVTNVKISDYPFNTGYSVDKQGNTALYDIETGERLTVNEQGHYGYNRVIEYDGLDSLKYISNSYFGVLYLIDELHLELNSLESKNIDIDVMTEISQQRKQRKHIVGTSQVYMRLAKPLREQIFDVVLCKNYFGFLQFNKLIDGETATEKDGKLDCTVKKHCIWIHKPSYYQRYDTFAKMKRYNKEWQGHKREAPQSFSFTVKGSDK